ncbi:hypothetical protein [Aquimarina longa]|uniref:hypothetical protein n=1 Tax=Aquimarina longa TaxID=1080221 RepID=UPI000781422A|nr:hypothetical protein [Aquimarina longa]
MIKKSLSLLAITVILCSCEAESVDESVFTSEKEPTETTTPENDKPIEVIDSSNEVKNDLNF